VKRKTRIIGVAVALAVVAVIAFSGVALAADPPEAVHTEWKFTGPGSVEIKNQSYTAGQTGSLSHLFVQTTGSYSSGYENVSVYPCGYYDWTGFSVERYAEIGDGGILGSFVRDNDYPYWKAYTEYGALLDTDGSGFMYQNFSNTYSYAGFQTHIEADCSYSMNAGEAGSIGGSWNFGIGANGDSSGVLDVNFTDRAEHNGWRLMYGGFYLYADPADARFSTNWSTLADFAGQTQTPDITQSFGVDVSGSGSYNTGASASWVTIVGYITGMK